MPEKFIDVLIKNLNFDKLSRDRESVIGIVNECINNSHHKYDELLHELFRRDLVDSEMISEVIHPYAYNHGKLTMFPKHLIKPEHLLGYLGSWPSYLEYYHDMITPTLVKEILERTLNALPYLPVEMISFEQVITRLNEIYSLDLDLLKKFSIVEIMKRYGSFYSDDRRYKYKDIYIEDYFTTTEIESSS